MSSFEPAEMKEHEKVVTVCCVCQRTKVAGKWVQQDVDTSLVSHGYCPRCFASVQNDISRYFTKTYSVREAA